MKKIFLNILCLLLICNALAKPPIEILPKNPNDPIALPADADKKVLIIGTE
jgi:hypothetical protein